MKTPSPFSRRSGASEARKTFLKLALLLAALAVPGLTHAGNLTGRYATITLDGSLSDWQPGDVMYSASEIAAGAPLNSSFTSVSVANDASYVYVAFQHPAPTTIADPWTTSVYLDTDMISTTGFNGGWMSAGYDRLVQYGASGTTYSAYGFTGSSQPAWGWNWLGLIGYSYSDLVTEWAIPISALGLTTDKMRMEFNVTGTGIATETWAYQWESGVGTYTVAVVPEPSSLSLLALGIGALFLGVKTRARP
jgi:hypothetical protein